MQQKHRESRGRLALRFGLAAVIGWGLIGIPAAQAQDGDPPGRVARLSYQSGDVAFAAAGEDNWGVVDLNRPLSIGDRLSTSGGSQAELELGGAELRLAEQSALNVVNLDDHTAQIEISGGTVNLHVRHLDDGETYEIDTPTMAFVANQVGIYRIAVFADNRGTQVRLYQGGGTAYGENNASYPLAGRQTFEFHSADLSDAIDAPLPSYGDEFDRFCQQRDSRYSYATSTGYVAPEVIGAVDLQDNGQWADDPDYQHVWYPTTVAADWAPYRQGHWAWIDPWGWTWVDNAPWGFAPFHYGRWVYVRERWGWVPGPPTVRPVYSPALVGFVGGGSLSVSVGGGAPVGWFPLGPRDVYCPPYQVSRGYFNNVNVANIHNTVNTTVINNYYENVQVNRGGPGNRFTPDYAYRNRPEATTVVSHDTFAGARPVGGARLNVDARQLAAAPVSFQPPAVPNRASLGVRVGGGFAGRPAPSAVFDRGPVMHNAAPPAPPSFAARQPMIERNQGQPVAPQQLHQMGQPLPAPGDGGNAMQGRSQPQNNSPAAPRNSYGDGQAFQQRPMPDRATPEQRVPMPNRSDDDRAYSQPRPQPQYQPQQQVPPQSRPQPASQPQQPLQGPRPAEPPQPMQRPQAAPQQQPPRPQAPPRPEPRREPPEEHHEHENRN